MKVTIANVGETIEVEPGETILEAAILAGIDYPCGCQSGNCGTCKSTLVAGDVEMSPYAAFALLPEESARGLVLACRAVPRQDCVIAWLEADAAIHARRVLRCRVAAVTAPADDVRRILLDIEAGGPFAFSAGQYARLAFDGLPPRDYSMANRPDREPLEFHIRLIGGCVSRHVGERLLPGERVRVEGPFGASYLRESHRGPIVAIAGSTGLAPVLSIVETALAKGMRQPIHLYFGARGERDLYLSERLESLAEAHENLRYVPVLSEPEGPTRRRTGMVTDAVAEDRLDLDGAKAYIAGPPAMVEAAAALLTGLGMRARDCHADPFYTEAELPQAGGEARP